MAAAHQLLVTFFLTISNCHPTQCHRPVGSGVRGYFSIIHSSSMQLSAVPPNPTPHSVPCPGMLWVAWPWSHPCSLSGIYQGLSCLQPIYCISAFHSRSHKPVGKHPPHIKEMFHTPCRRDIGPSCSITNAHHIWQEKWDLWCQTVCIYTSCLSVSYTHSVEEGEVRSH